MLRWLAQIPSATRVMALLAVNDDYKKTILEGYKTIIAEQGRWYTAIIRPLLAAPVIIYLWKVIVWDIVLGLGSTDPIGGDVAQWAGSIVTAYVGGRSLEKIARTIWRRP